MSVPKVEERGRAVGDRSSCRQTGRTGKARLEFLLQQRSCKVLSPRLPREQVGPAFPGSGPTILPSNQKGAVIAFSEIGRRATAKSRRGPLPLPDPSPVPQCCPRLLLRRRRHTQIAVYCCCYYYVNMRSLLYSALPPRLLPAFVRLSAN